MTSDTEQHLRDVLAKIWCMARDETDDIDLPDIKDDDPDVMRQIRKLAVRTLYP